MTRHPARSLLVGVLFGGTLSVLGFSSWDAIHDTLVFGEAQLALIVFFAIALIASLWMRYARSERPEWSVALAPGTLRGAILFGAGFAISGATPALAFVALGEGKLGALATLAGVLLGNMLVARFGTGARKPRSHRPPSWEAHPA